MHPSALNNGKLFFDTYTPHFLGGDESVRVVEIGSQDVNGSIRQFCPQEFEYIGVDFVDGMGVDLVITSPYELPFEDNSVDIVVSSSCFEHSEMFWVVYLEIVRILKPHGLFYLNVPSNGMFHRYPVDCWRFYPDSGQALVTWAQYNGQNVGLLESYTSNQISDDWWNDFVAVYIKNKDNSKKYPKRMLHTEIKYTNGISDRLTAGDFLNFCEHNEDQRVRMGNLARLEEDAETLLKLSNEIAILKYKISEAELQVSEQDSQLVVKDQQLHEQSQQLHEQSQQLHEQSQQLHEQSQQLDAQTHQHRKYKTLWTIRLVKPLIKTEQALSSVNALRKGFRRLVKAKGSIGKAYQHVRRLKNAQGFRAVKSFLRAQQNHEPSVVDALIALKPVNNVWVRSGVLRNEYDISVIIPTYNRAHMLPDLLESWRKVHQITKYSYEIIFSDDGSSDNTVEILESIAYELPLIILKNTHGGASKARNSAIRAAKGEKLLIMGDDIYPNAEIINQHVEKLKMLKVTDAVLGECIWHRDIKVNHLMKHITEIGCEQFSFPMIPKNGYTDFRHFYTCNISIDREFLLSEDVVFNEVFYKYGFEDIELGYRLAKKGMQIYFFPEAVGEHYHPYHDIHKFCMRQECAGEMALIFVNLHEEIESIVNVNAIKYKWSQYFNGKDDFVQNSIYNELITFCQFIEDNFETSHSDLSTYLSTVYRQLFRFAYEKGVYGSQIVDNSCNLNDVLRNEFLTKKIYNALRELNLRCNVTNYTKLMELCISDLDQTPLLLIEAVDSVHLSKLINLYGQFKPMVGFYLKSDGFKASDTFIYRPEINFYLHENNFRQILLLLKNYRELDAVFLSFGLNDFPYIGLSGYLSNSFIFKGNIAFKDNQFKDANQVKTKVLRLFENIGVEKTTLSEVFGNGISCDDYGFLGKNKVSSTQILSFQNSFLRASAGTQKPVIFVFPIFLAVGGVERNTIEIIKKLNDKYDFVIITFERLKENHGSLHHQFLNACVGLYDLTEIGRHADILDNLDFLNELYKPQAVWICNGSPWLAENMINLRSLFSTAAIIDQQVYDIDAGWISLYYNKAPGLLEFDRFIAINSRIKKTFTETIGIRSTKVDLIYSVMSSEKREIALQNSRDTLCKKYGLDSNRKYFVFVGRLVPQKAPMDLLKLIKLMIEDGGIDFHFVLVGSGELNEDVEKYIKNNRLGDFITRFDYIDNTFEISMISEAIVFTSLYEGLSIALLEALSVGIPGISTDVGETKVIFDKYQNGMTFKTIGNIDEYLSTFKVFLKNLEYYKSNAQQYAHQIAFDFSADYISTQYLECFGRAIDNRRKVSL